MLHRFIFLASFVSAQNESNLALCLTTRAGKMEQSCPLGTIRPDPQDKSPQKPYIYQIIKGLICKENVALRRWEYYKII